MGEEALHHSNVDGAERWTMVGKSHSFKASGYVLAVEFYSSVADRPLRVGIYRGTGCSLILIQQVEIAGSRIQSGYNSVRMPFLHHNVRCTPVQYMHIIIYMGFARQQPFEV